MEHFNVDEVHGQVFSFCFYDDKCIDKKLLDHQRRNKDEMAPFLIIDSTREVLQSTVKPNREDSIAIQLAVRWQVPSKRGLPDGSWKEVYWREIVAVAEMHFTVETAQYLIDQADEASWRTRARYDGRTLSRTSTQIQSLPTIMEIEPDVNTVPPSSFDDTLLANNGATERDSKVQSQVPEGRKRFCEIEDAAEGLMRAVVKNNIHRLRLWITGHEGQIKGVLRPRMVDEAFSLMKSLTNVDGFQAVADSRDPNAQAFLAGPRVVKGDFDHVFEHLFGKASIPGGKIWRFVSSESVLNAKRRTNLKNKIILIYKLSVTFEVDSVVMPPLSVEDSGVMVIKQMERFGATRQESQADDLASTSVAESSLVDTYSALESLYWERRTGQTSHTSHNNSLPDGSTSSTLGKRVRRLSS